MSPAPTITAIIIAKNEANNLSECIASLSWANQIIVFDSGSSDNSQQIAEQAGAEFHQNKDWPGFGRQRQLAQEKANGDWCLWVDADERISPELADSIKRAVNGNKQQIYAIARKSWVFGRFLEHSGWYPDWVIRLHPKDLTRYNDALVHEKVLIPEGMQVKRLQGDMLHYTYESMEHYLVKSAGYAKAWADQRQAKGKKASLSQGIGHAVGCFMKMYVLKAGFLDGKQGFLIAALSAHSTFVKYADLWIRANDNENRL